MSKVKICLDSGHIGSTYNQSPVVKTYYESTMVMYLIEGATEGVRGDVAFAQSLHETGFFRFGGIIQPEQNNFAGIGALNHLSPYHRIFTCPLGCKQIYKSRPIKLRRNNRAAHILFIFHSARQQMNEAE